MRILINTALFSLVLLVTASTLQAARTCRIVYPERPQDAPNAGYLFDGTKNHPVNFSSKNFSKVIELSDDTTSIALSSIEIPSTEALSIHQPKLKIPKDCSSFYIIMMPDEKNHKLPVKLLFVDSSPNKLAAGETLWINLTLHRLAGKLGGANMELNPRSKVITRDPNPTSGHYTAKLTFQKEGKGDYAPLTEQSWWHDAQCKHLGFIMNTGGKLPQIYYFRDFR